MLKRAFDIDICQCPHYGGKLGIIAAILKRAVIETILTYLGLEVREPPRARAHAPPADRVRDAMDRRLFAR